MGSRSLPSASLAARVDTCAFCVLFLSRHYPTSNKTCNYFCGIFRLERVVNNMEDIIMDPPANYLHLNKIRVHLLSPALTIESFAVWRDLLSSTNELPLGTLIASSKVTYASHLTRLELLPLIICGFTQIAKFDMQCEHRLLKSMVHTALLVLKRYWVCLSLFSLPLC